jgi:hypothetical protein
MPFDANSSAQAFQAIPTILYIGLIIVAAIVIFGVIYFLLTGKRI